MQSACISFQIGQEQCIAINKVKLLTVKARLCYQDDPLTFYLKCASFSLNKKSVKDILCSNLILENSDKCYTVSF
jgi:hypothetical protein